MVEYDIKDSTGSVKEYFDVITLYGTMTIEKRIIEISSRDVEKKYDGKELAGKVEDCYISKGSLIEGHRYSVKVSAKITDVGQTENRIEQVFIYNENSKLVGFIRFDAAGNLMSGNESWYNYEIIVNNGTLSIIQ